MKIIRTTDYEGMSDAAFAAVKEAVLADPKATLGLATGSTPLGLYKRMIADHAAAGTSYREIKTVNLDEYVSLPADHPQSYAYFMRKNLFDGLDIDPANTHIASGTADPGEECVRYNILLEALPRDLQILGIGSNGHIAFNEPGTPFGSVTHLVALAESTIRDNSRLFEKAEDVPRYAITMGLSNIMHAKRILILASGENKKRAVSGLVKGPVTEDLPASILRLHPDCTLIVDEAAASLL